MPKSKSEIFLYFIYCLYVDGFFTKFLVSVLSPFFAHQRMEDGSVCFVVAIGGHADF